MKTSVLIVLALVGMVAPSAHAADRGQTATATVTDGFVFGTVDQERVLRGSFTLTVPSTNWTRVSAKRADFLEYTVRESATCTMRVRVEPNGDLTRLSAKSVASKEYYGFGNNDIRLVRAKSQGAAWWGLEQAMIASDATLGGDYVVPLQQPRALGVLRLRAYADVPREEGACDADTVGHGVTRAGINRMMARVSTHLSIVKGKRR